MFLHNWNWKFYLNINNHTTLVQTRNFLKSKGPIRWKHTLGEPLFIQKNDV
jgi:hypothetical protein